MKKCILVQEADTALVLIKRFRENADDYLWVTYDPVSLKILKHSNIKNIISEEVLLGNKYEELSHKASTTATDWSCSWFRDQHKTTKEADFDPSVFHRESCYTFLAALRGFIFLEHLFLHFGPLNIITARKVYKKQQIRWETSSHPVNLLLDHFGMRRWQFHLEYISLPDSTAGFFYSFGSIFLEVINEWAMALQRINVKEKNVILSGNSALLDPIAKELNLRGFRTTATFFGDKLKHVVKSLFSNSLFLFRRQKNLVRESNGMKDLYRQLEEKRVFDFCNEDLLPIFWCKLHFISGCQMPLSKKYFKQVSTKLAKLSPHALIVDEDATANQRLLVIAARKLNINTFVMLHGLPGTKLGFVPLEADSILSWGPYETDILKRWGVEKNRIIDVGCPKYDVLSRNSFENLNPEMKEKLCEKHGLNKSYPLILVLPRSIRSNALELQKEEISQSTNEILRSIDIFESIAKQFPHINIIFKFRISDEKVRKIMLEQILTDLKRYPNLRYILEGNGLDYIKGCDILINTMSSALLEGLLLGKIVLHMNLSKYEDLLPMNQIGFTGIIIKSISDLTAFCERLILSEIDFELYRKEQSNILRSFLILNPDESSAIRCAKAIANSREK